MFLSIVGVSHDYIGVPVRSFDWKYIFVLLPCKSERVNQKFDKTREPVNFL